MMGSREKSLARTPFGWSFLYMEKSMGCWQKEMKES
jgi:hypothetical protein